MSSAQSLQIIAGKLEDVILHFLFNYNGESLLLLSHPFLIFAFFYYQADSLDYNNLFPQLRTIFLK